MGLDVSVLPRDPATEAMEHRDRCLQAAASTDGMIGPAAFEVLAPMGSWPGSVDPADVAEVIVRPGNSPRVPLSLTFRFKPGEAVGDG